MNVEKIFEKYHNGNANLLTPFPYEHGVKTIGQYVLLFEKSKGRSPWSNWKLRHSISFLIVCNNTIQKIDIGHYTDKGQKEIDKYLNNLTEEQVRDADRFGEIKKMIQ